jgi:hypothetical protein
LRQFSKQDTSPVVDIVVVLLQSSLFHQTNNVSALHQILIKVVYHQHYKQQQKKNWKKQVDVATFFTAKKKEKPTKPADISPKPISQSQSSSSVTTTGTTTGTGSHTVESVSAIMIGQIIYGG